MKTFLFMLFILFSFGIYFLNNSIILFLLFFLSLLLLISFKINFTGLKGFLIFTLFTVIINLFFTSYQEAMGIGIRLFIIYFFTLLISFYMSNREIAKSIAKLFFFLKNKQDIEVIIFISLSLIPIFINEVKEIKKVLISKNFPFTFKNAFFKPSIFLNTFLTNLFRRIKELEKTLQSKNYQ